MWCRYVWWILMMNMSHAVDKFGWDISILTRTEGGYITASTLTDIAPLQNITDLIASSDLRNIMTAIQGDFYATPYYISLQISNYGEVAMDDTRQVALIGAQPKVILTYEMVMVDGKFRVPQKTELEPALIDLHSIESTSNTSCDFIICQPVWIFPLPLDGIGRLISIQISNVMTTHLMADKKIYRLWIQGFADESGNLPGLIGPEITGPVNITTTQAQTLQYIPQFSVLQALVISDGSVIGFTTDEFEHLHFHQVFSSDGYSVCDCEIAVKVATLPDRIIFLKESGVWEILRNRTDVNGTISSSYAAAQVLDACIADVDVSAQSMAPQTWQVVLRGACQHTSKIYTASLQFQSGMSLSFVETGDVCESMVDTSNCSIVTSAVSGSKAGTVFLLVHAHDDVEDHHFYRFMSASNETANEMVRFSAEIHGDHLRYPSYVALPDITAMHGDEDSVSLVLRGITTTRQVSPHVYVWGRHILHSADGGHHFSMLTSYHGNEDIIMSSCSGVGNIVTFLTQSHEIWVTFAGLDDVWCMYPSVSWDVVMANTDQGNTDLSAVNIVTMFFTSLNQLKLVYYVENVDDGFSTLMISVDAVLEHMSISQVTSSDLSTGDVGPSVSQVSSCVYDELILEIPRSYQSYHAKEVRLSSRPPKLSYEPALHTPLTVATYGAILEKFHLPGVTEESPLVQKHQDQMTLWTSDLLMDTSYQKYMFQTFALSDGMQAELSAYSRIFIDDTDGKTSDVPKIFYLNYLENMTYTLSVTLNDQQAGTDVGLGISLDDVVLRISETDKDLLNVTVSRKQFFNNYTVIFQVNVADVGTLGYRSNPGEHLYTTSVQLLVWNAPPYCFSPEQQGSSIQGTYDLTFLVGCSPAQRIQFDYHAAWDRLTSQQYEVFDCTIKDPLYPCFYYGHNFYPSFQVYDSASGTWTLYNGSYSLKVIGGSQHSVETIEYFTEEQVFAYNNDNQNTSSKIWGPINMDVLDADGWAVFTEETKGIQWFCQPESPCAHVLPHVPHTPEYFFLVEFSNRMTDSYCDFTMEFVVRVHGLPLDAIRTSLYIVFVTLVSCVVFVLLYIFCHWNSDFHYNRTKGALRKVIRKRRRSRKVGPTSDEQNIEREGSDQSSSIIEGTQEDWRTLLERRLAELAADLSDSSSSSSSSSECLNQTFSDTGDIPQINLDDIPKRSPSDELYVGGARNKSRRTVRLSLFNLDRRVDSASDLIGVNPGSRFLSVNKFDTSQVDKNTHFTPLGNSEEDVLPPINSVQKQEDRQDGQVPQDSAELGALEEDEAKGSESDSDRSETIIASRDLD